MQKSSWTFDFEFQFMGLHFLYHLVTMATPDSWEETSCLPAGI